MKTSFTKLFKEKWKAIVPFLFFCTMSFVVKADFAPCGKLDSIAEISLIIDCDGNLTVVAEDSSPTGYEFGIVGVGAISGTFYKKSDPLVHFTINHDPESTFYVRELCGSVLWYGVLPYWGNGGGAGTWMYTGEGKEVDDPGMTTVASPKDVPDGISAKVTYKVTKPSCPDADDGSVEFHLDLGTAKNCDPTIGITYSGAASASNAPFVDGKYTISGLSAADVIENISFLATASGSECVCDVDTPDGLGPITVPTPVGNSASLACIDKINVSSAIDPHNCEVIISKDDINSGVNDPCDDNESAEYIIVKDKKGKLIEGTYLDSDLVPLDPQTGSGYAFKFDASSYFGQEVKVEVHDEMSGNHCWGHALVEDKAPPVVTCDENGIDSIYCIDFTGDLEESMKAAIKDCSDFDPTVVQFKEILDCDDNTSVLKRIQMVYFAEDVWGNRSDQCTDTIDILRIGTPDDPMASDPDLTFIPGVRLLRPLDFAKNNDPFSCDDFYDVDGDGIPDPTESGAGFPMLEKTRDDGSKDTFPLPALNFDHYADYLNRAKSNAITYCKLGASYRDTRLGSYDCVTKIMRTWSIGEWSCHGELDTMWTQIIDIVDTLAPVFDKSSLKHIVGSVDSYNCSKMKPIPMPSAYDNCSKTIEFQRVVFDADWTIIGPDKSMSADEDFEFPYGRSYVVFTAFDECHNFSMDTIHVDITDETPPVTICKDQLVVGISGSKGSQEDGLVKVPASSFDNGTYDDCGLKETCVVRMDDLDRFDAMDTDGDGWVPLSEFSDEFACNRSDYYAQYADVIPHTKPAVYGIYRGVLCQKEIWFCCNDDRVRDVNVVFRAIDHSGNINECMVSVDIQDKTKPSIICPVDVKVDCDLPMPSVPEEDLNEWINVTQNPAKDYFGDLFGRIVREHSQEPFGVHPDHVHESVDLSKLVDGLFFDNCDDPDIYIKIGSDFDQCNTGQIIRYFYAEDGSGNRSEVCEQVITVDSKIEFDFYNIKWPVEDTLLNTCMLPEDLTTMMFGVPSAPDGACMLFGTSYEDQVFRFNNQDNPDSEACFKLIRTWNVIDWCSNEHSGNTHIVPFQQIIKVNDPVGPQISCPPENLLVETTDCEGAIVELTASATDDCTEADELHWFAKIDAYNDGSYDFKPEDLESLITHSENAGASEASISYRFPAGTHRISWYVEDRCGNTSNCEYLFTVSNVKAPTPFAVDVSTVLMSSGMVGIWANDINNKSEHPCYDDEAIQIAIVRAGGAFEEASASITFDCDDFINGPEVDVDFYAFIDLGNGHILKDFTTVTVTLQDNQGACSEAIGDGEGTGQSAFITGSIRTENADAVPDIEVGLLGGNQGANAVNATATDITGAYAFPEMPVGTQYTIDPVSNGDYLNGVTTLDLVLIQRYVLGMTDLESEYKIIAADINNDRNVSAIDLVDLRSVILGVSEEFTNNESWRFIDADFTFSDATEPLSEPFTEQYDISTLEANMNINFIGVKVGDVNGTVDAASTLAQSRSIFSVDVADINYNAGDIISIPLRVSKDINTVGLQFTADFDASQLIFAGVDSDELNVLPEHVGFAQANDGIVTISWNDVNAQRVGASQSLMSLNFKAVKSGRLSDVLSLNSAVTSAEIYNAQLETMGLVAKFNSSTNIADAGFELYQNTPNPFADQTTISFNLPQSSDATLSIFDVTGKLITIKKGSFDKGINTIQLNKDDLSVSGVLYYTLETEGFTDTKRMVVLK